MPTCRLNDIETVHIGCSVVADTLRLLQAYGAHGCEGLVLWLGMLSDREARVTHAFVPEQQSIKNEAGVGYFVDGAQLFSLNRALDETGLRLVAQVHSHPGRAYHSEADDKYAIVTAEGGFSLVVPNFGSAPPDLTYWAVYRLRQGRWKEVPTDSVRRLFGVERNSDR